MKKINKYLRVFIYISMTMVCYVSSAQDFHYGAIFDATGPIKEIKTDSKNPLVEKKVKIDKQGRGGLAMMMYDNSGLPLGFEMNMLGKQNYQKFYWNDDNRLDSVSMKIELIGDCKLITAKNTYSGKPLSSQKIEIKTKDGNIRYLRIFSEYTYDEASNWISRKVKQTSIDKNGEETNEEYIETRFIKYYTK